jgi:hypothetical protein
MPCHPLTTSLDLRIICSPTWRTTFNNYSVIVIFQNAKVYLVIYGQQNVCLCTMTMELQWEKEFVTVSNQVYLSEARDHLETRKLQSKYQRVLSRMNFQTIGAWPITHVFSNHDFFNHERRHKFNCRGLNQGVRPRRG